MPVEINNLRLSLVDLVGPEYVDEVCEARAFLTGGSKAEYMAIGQEKIDFFPPQYQERLDRLLPFVGRQVVSGFPSSSAGAPTAAFVKASHKAMAPLSAMGFYRIGEDGRLYLTTKSEHYHASLGHDFPGYRLVQQAQRLGITNVTHNNTRGHITRLVERELVRVANGLPKGDEAALDRVFYVSGDPHVLNRIINLETGSLAVEAALKMILARFYRQDDTFPQPEFAGRTPVFLVIADLEGGPKANYHGTTVLTQILRGMWPDLAAGMADHGLYRLQPVRINDIDDFRAAIAQWDSRPFRVAAFFHEIVLMNYGAIRLSEEYLRAAYDLCHAHDVPIVADEIQSCAWSPELFLFREYGLNPDFVSIGKGFPGGQYPASRILSSARYDTLNQFGALVTNGQEELASLTYLVTMAFVDANCEYVRALGNYYFDRLSEIATEFPKLIEKAEGHRHLGSLFFHTADGAVAFMKEMNRAGYDVSAQTYKANCPPAILTKVPLISSYRMIDQFAETMAQVLPGLTGWRTLAADGLPPSRSFKGGRAVPETTIRFGIIGCGLMAREFASAVARWSHLLDVGARPRIVAVADRNDDCLCWFNDNVADVELAVTDYHDLLADPNVDAVYCAVPHHLHARIYSDIIAAGKHLLGEKPFGIDLAANVQILEALRSRPEVFARCSSQLAFFPGAYQIVRYLREQRFGKIIEVEAGFWHSSDMDPLKPINWKRQIELNGEYGCMGDLGLHVLYIPLRFGWLPRSVHGLLSKIVTERPGPDGQMVACETWDNAMLACEVESGEQHFPMLASMKRIAPGETNTWFIKVHGTQFSAEFSTKYPKTLRTLTYRRGEPQAWQSLDLGYQSAYPAITGSIFEFGFSDAILQQVAAFCDELAHGPDMKQPFGCATPEETHQHHRILTAALESQRSGQVIYL